jgi:hypothetical protein
VHEVSIGRAASTGLCEKLGIKANQKYLGLEDTIMKNAVPNIGWGALGALALAAILISFRWIAVFFFAIWVVTVAFRRGLRNQWSIATILIGIIFCCFQPFDISFETRPGPPRIVRVIYGKPTRKAIEMAKRGEVMLGGCVVIGFEPEWVLIW